MMTESSYQDWLKQDYGTLIDALQLDNIQKHFMHSRWLDQVLWMESNCEKTQRWYYILRISAIIGGIIVPALVTLKISWAATILSLVVAISVAVEEFFHFGERFRHYRRTAELLKIQAWQFFQRSGPYQQFSDYKSSYPLFAGEVEKIMQNEVDVYITQVVREKEKEKKKE